MRPALDDQTAPAPVTGVSAVRDGGAVILRWTNPVAADLAGVIVRWYPGPIAPRKGSQDS